MKNTIFSRRKTAFEQARTEEPEVLFGKKLTLALIIIWVLCRLFYIVVEALCVYKGFTSFSVSNITMALVTIVFIYLIYFQGSRVLATIMPLGSVMMLYQLMTEQLYLVYGDGYDIWARLYVTAFIVAEVGQLIACILLLTVKKLERYFNFSAAVYKEHKSHVLQRKEQETAALEAAREAKEQKRLEAEEKFNAEIKEKAQARAQRKEEKRKNK